MQRGQQLQHRSALELPAGFDPSGIPCADAGPGRSASARRRRRPHGLAGLQPMARTATVMEVIPREFGDWFAWGCVDGRPVMFAVTAGTGAEMAHAVALGEYPTAIVEPGQVVLEPLD